MRKMATIRRIDSIRSIDGADAIECAVVGGWSVVIKKGEFKPGDLAVYCEIDSWIPYELASFLSKDKEPREFNGVKGEKLKTIRLRGQLSQGLLLPLSVLPDHPAPQFEDDDVSELLGIQKWEAPVPAQLAGDTKGNFPSFIPKTDQERCQNLKREITACIEYADKFEVTEKLEGSSLTCYRYQGEFGVCSRNQELKKSETNTFWKIALENKIEERMTQLGLDNIAIQGELIGPGIQGNIYKLTNHQFHVFDIYDIYTGGYLDPDARRDIVAKLRLNHVPVINASASLGEDLKINNIDALLSFAMGSSVLLRNQEREGVVFKSVNGGLTFKAISNKYLIKQG